MTAVALGPQPSDAAHVPTMVDLLSRVGCHVYSGEMLADGEYRETYTGPGVELMLGGPVPPGADVAECWLAAIHPDDREAYQQAGVNGSPSTIHLEYRMVGVDGVTRWVLDQMWVRKQLFDGRRLVDGVVTDITELRRTSAQAAEAAAWLDAAVSVSPAALILMDREARVQLWNPAAEKLFGWTSDEVIGKVAPHVPEARRTAFLELLERMASGHPLLDHEEIRSGRDGRPQNVAISSALVRNANGEVAGFMGVVTDITARKQAENQLRQLAHSDPLTGLANRILVTQRIDEAVAQLDGADHGIALLLLDLDGFKAVNDGFGHAVGDELLLAVARRVESCLRTADVAARLGGDEFAVLLEVVDSEEALAIGQRVLDALTAPFALRRAEVVVTASVGLVHAESQRSTEDLLRDADVAMYRAKAEGKNRIVVFEPSMQETVAARLRLEAELRAAVEQDQFELFYQPFVDLDSRRIVGMEALIRWRHPTRGLLLPAEFIDVAEDTGLIVPLGRWIIQRACTDAASWQPPAADESLSISVNLSPRQLHDPQLIDVTEQALAGTGLPATALIVEITENLLLGDTALAGARLAELRSLGIRVAVDDFGTGYSSLAYLRRFPVDIIKIDRSFVAPLTDGPRPAALVRSIIDLARALDVETVAEGVEDAAQADTLYALGCHIAQGFFFARPQLAASIRQLLTSRVPAVTRTAVTDPTVAATR